MPIIIDNVTTNLRSLSNAVIPTRINIGDSFQTGFSKVPYGRNRNFQRDSNASIQLEFDVFYDTNIVGLRNVLNNRAYPKKAYVNEPATGQLLDFYNYAVVGNHCKHDATFTTPGSPVELTPTEYGYIQNIDANKFSYSQNSFYYTWIFMTFNLAPYIALYGLPSIERLTLFLHNAYAEFSLGAQLHKDGIKVFCFNGDLSGPLWFTIGEQSITINDDDLQAMGQINQQFFSFRKVQDLFQFQDQLLGGNTFTVAFRNLNPAPAGWTASVGFNYAGLLINGFGVKQDDADNFTYREECDQAGSIGTVNLKEC